MIYRLTQYRVKKGSEPQAEAFIRKINEERDEVLRLLDRSEIEIDCSFLDRSEEQFELYIFLKLADLERTNRLLEKDTSSIYAFIDQAVKDFTETRISWVSYAPFDRSEK